jgi:hypothetical protein
MAAALIPQEEAEVRLDREVLGVRTGRVECWLSTCGECYQTPNQWLKQKNFDFLPKKYAANTAPGDGYQLLAIIRSAAS